MRCVEVEENCWVYLQLGTGRLAMNVLFKYVIVLDLPMVTRIVHPNEHVIDTQKVTQQHKESGGHNTLQAREGDKKREGAGLDSYCKICSQYNHTHNAHTHHRDAMIVQLILVQCEIMIE